MLIKNAISVGSKLYLYVDQYCGYFLVSKFGRNLAQTLTPVSKFGRVLVETSTKLRPNSDTSNAEVWSKLARYMKNTL